MTRILVADDHAFLRAGLEQVLGRLGHEIVASVGDGAAALAAIAQTRPDLAIVDLRMPAPDGVGVLSALRDAGDALPVLILAAELDDASLVAAVQRGVNAIVLKHAPPGALQAAITAVMAGERAIAMDLMERAFAAATRPAATGEDAMAALSDRDRQIAEGVAAGLRNRDIADSLGVTEGTVKINLHRLYDRLGVANRTELALLVKTGAHPRP
ncbi:MULTISPECIES: response regulator transcription factor [Novosphingobium]|uniref:response regulator n=1 Tax=Novosphingobium TaxID=165696 RepID=UPI0007892B87|nr:MULTISPECIES: response regulator transcription factor [Novosphingobium]MBB3358140.1 two-component system nitrate/nitrite response regulator NarP [Novosphingobium sp. BK256]MBB3374501.1 two-component system nitrate/nitrite response regulator NarP [Novosphingobium sp. BK280]MBB3378913.1 two-component system nitrate/nitrite response regulator NarP [Novosphingobium sp. BK258]MBB3420607.1 two-component system nitrate/nitrite response regulator NarP [Novosphingobium sp. BK267]MBB3448271.1 two-com